MLRGLRNGLQAGRPNHVVPYPQNAGTLGKLYTFNILWKTSRLHMFDISTVSVLYTPASPLIWSSEFGLERFLGGCFVIDCYFAGPGSAAEEDDLYSQIVAVAGTVSWRLTYVGYTGGGGELADIFARRAQAV